MFLLSMNSAKHLRRTMIDYWGLIVFKKHLRYVKWNICQAAFTFQPYTQRIPRHPSHPTRIITRWASSRFHIIIRSSTQEIKGATLASPPSWPQRDNGAKAGPSQWSNLHKSHKSSLLSLMTRKWTTLEKSNIPNNTMLLKGLPTYKEFQSNGTVAIEALRPATNQDRLGSLTNDAREVF